MPFITKVGSAAARAYGWLATTVSVAVNDAYFYLVSLLLSTTSTNGAQNNTFLDSSPNNFTITRNGNTTQGSFSPFSQTGWSNYFDGTGDYLSYTGGSSLNFETSDFTIELWGYLTNTGTFSAFLRPDDNGSFPEFGYDFSAGVLKFDARNSVILNTTVAMPVQQWVHLAVSRSGTTLRQFINGVQVGSVTNSTNFASTTGLIRVGGSGFSAAHSVLGYISNFRVVKGVALYTNSFTPPATPLTAVSGTSLLTCQSNRIVDNSANNFTITRNGDVAVQAFSPFVPNNISPTSYSGWFDGSGDFLQIDSSSLAFNSTTQPFTVEAWVYMTAVGGVLYCNQIATLTNIAIGFSSTTNGFNDTNANQTGGRYIVFGFYAGGVNWNQVVSNTQIILNTWNHIACVFTGTACKIYLNGSDVTTGTLSAWTTSTGTASYYIGRRWDSAAGAVLSMTGLISNLRVVKGTAVYTSSFTPPTAPLTAIANTSLLTCQNATFIDNSTNAFAITVNGNAQPRTLNPFGYTTTQPASYVASPTPTSYSGWFDGTGGYLTVPDNAAFTLGTGDFTIEFWFYQLENSISYIVSQNSGTSATSAFDINVNSLTIYGVIYYGSSFIALNGGAISLNRWNHIALCRSGSTLSIYVNGTSTATNSSAGVTINDSSVPIRVSGINSGLYLLKGNVSNLRIVKGTAVYTSNFTPPTAPLTAITNTSLLTCQNATFIDNSSNAFAITANGNAQTNANNPFGYTTTGVIGGSGYFDGTGDWLTISDSPALDLPADFTIETWVYITENTNRAYSIVGKWGAPYAWILSANPSTGAITFSYGNSGTFVGTATFASSFSPNRWANITVTRSGSSVRAFLDGAQIGTTQTITSNLTASTVLYIGRDDGITRNFVGTISNIRVIKGTALYTSAFAPPPAPLTPVAGTSLLLNCTNAGIYDAASQSDLETVGNAQVSTTQAKWGSTAVAFDGTGDWLLIPHQPTQFLSTGNFTIEMWVYRNSSGTYGLVGKGTATTGWLVSLNSSNQVVFTYGSSTITSTGTVSATTWTFIAVVRSGTSTNQTKIYINGTNDGTGTVSTDFSQTNSMYVGADRTGGSNFSGYIDDLRITKYARYTANFTPPTTAFPTQ